VVHPVKEIVGEKQGRARERERERRRARGGKKYILYTYTCIAYK
jgi:hypothetical protein